MESANSDEESATPALGTDVDFLNTTMDLNLSMANNQQDDAGAGESLNKMR